MSPNPAITLDASVLALVRRAWRHALGDGAEPCGYLLASPTAPGVIRAAWPGRNTHPEPARAFQLEPEEQLEVRRRARREGLELVGIWHGHLEGRARPSDADRRGQGPLAPPWMLIAGREADVEPRLRLWRRSEDSAEWIEVPYREGIAAAE